MNRTVTAWRVGWNFFSNRPGGTQQILTQKPDGLIPLIPATGRFGGELQIERNLFVVKLVRLQIIV